MNTLLIVEAETAVPWTKADELAFEIKGNLPKLGDPAKQGAFLAGFARPRHARRLIFGFCWHVAAIRS